MNHPNIMKLKEITKEHDTLFCVFEYMVSGFLPIIKFLVVLI